MTPHLKPPCFKSGVRLHLDRVRARWVLLAPERVVELDDTAKAILERIDGVSTVATIAAALAIDYDADASEISEDITALVDDLSLKGYVAA
jgi:pyrroloquinoline quinone biosynthesis protein D